jgi:hypothetical protein
MGFFPLFCPGESDRPDFREAAEVIAAAANGSLNRAKMFEVFRRHGMTVTSPPPAK